MRRLERRRALVTGGSRGLGAAVARRLAQEGCGVAISGRRESEHARAVIETIAAQGGQAVLVTGDVGEAAAAAGIVERAAGKLGGLDIVVNSAGIWRGGRLKDANLDDWHEIWRINIMGTMHVTRAALPYLEAAAKSGTLASVVVMSSSVGFKGFPGDTAYATTKAGLVGFTRALAKELARKGNHGQCPHARLHQRGSDRRGAPEGPRHDAGADPVGAAGDGGRGRGGRGVPGIGGNVYHGAYARYRRRH